MLFVLDDVTELWDLAEASTAICSRGSPVTVAFIRELHREQQARGQDFALWCRLRPWPRFCAAVKCCAGILPPHGHDLN